MTGQLGRSNERNVSSWSKYTSFEELQIAVHETAKEHGWWEGKDLTCIPEKLALIHSEISEALEEYRKGSNPSVRYYEPSHELTEKPEGFGVELADAVIRIMDLCEWLGIDLAGLVVEKHEYNLTRSFKHGGKLA